MRYFASIFAAFFSGALNVSTGISGTDVDGANELYIGNTMLSIGDTILAIGD